jgi:preprotein translocase subunit YajC
MIVLMLAAFYFIFYRGDKKKKKKAKEMRDSLAVGDTITTIGGFVGKIIHVTDETVTFETSEDRVRVEIAKWGIQTIGKATEEQPK